MKKLTAHQKKAFAILTKADRSIVKKEVVEVQDKVAMIPSFVGKHISMFIQPSSRFITVLFVNYEWKRKQEVTFLYLDK